MKLFTDPPPKKIKNNKISRTMNDSNPHKIFMIAIANLTIPTKQHKSTVIVLTLSIEVKAFRGRRKYQ